MKSFLSVCAFLILFQSLFSGSLGKLDLPDVYPDKWEVIRFSNHEPIDIFFRPDQRSKVLNLQNRNHWFLYQFGNAYSNKNISTSPAIAEIPFNSIRRHYYSSTPVFIINGEFRL